MKMLAALVALSGTGCIAMSVRAHTAVVADDRGHGIQAGLAFGFGYSMTSSSGVLASMGAASGNAPRFGISSNLDYVRLDKKLGWRAGYGVAMPLVGGGSLAGLHVASLFVIKDSETSSYSEKSCCSGEDRTTLAVGLEGAIGVVIHPSADPMQDNRLGGSVALSLELLQFSRWSL